MLQMTRHFLFEAYVPLKYHVEVFVVEGKNETQKHGIMI